MLDSRDLNFRRKTNYTIKVSLIEKDDTIRSIISNNEIFDFQNVPKGKYKIVVSNVEPNRFIITDVYQNQWSSPWFEVEVGKLTMLTSYRTGAGFGLEEPYWCIYQLDNALEKEEGILILDLSSNDLISPSDSVFVSIRDKYIPDFGEKTTFIVPQDKRIRLRAKPGFYELNANVVRTDTNKYPTRNSIFYSRILLNILILPQESTLVDMSEFEELDQSVYLFETDPKIFYQLFKNCKK